MIVIPFISGLALVVLVALGGWEDLKISQAWKVILLIIAITLIFFSVLCAYKYVTNSQAIAITKLATLEEGDNKTQVYKIESGLTAAEYVNKAFTIIPIACVPFGLLLILLSILCAQKFTEKQQKDLRIFAGWLIFISLLMISQSFS